MFDDLKKNIEQEKKIIADIRAIQDSMQSDADNQNLYLSSLKALSDQLIFLNKAVPSLLKEWSPIAKIEEVEAEKESVNIVKSSPKKNIVKPIPKNDTIKMSYVSPSTKEKRYISINKDDKKEFLKHLKLSEGALVGIKRMESKNQEMMINKPSSFVRVSNKMFRELAEKMVPRFDSLSKDLKRANVRFLLSSYLSMAILSTVISFGVGLVIFALLLVVSLSNWIHFYLPLVFPAMTMMAFYFYPASEASSVQKKISQELPFTTIYMAAIAGSNIEPTKIFKIIATSAEYPNVGKEIRKILNQIDIYGYDLVTSLKNVAARTSNKKLGELFSGLAANISSGGSLKNFLEKKAENFLLDYKLERQKYSDLAGTFMDVYISILIAAPLVLMMMFIVMNVSGLSLGGLGITTLLMLSIAGIVVVNIIFLIVLNIKQPKV
jgi:hypothetical protein